MAQTVVRIFFRALKLVLAVLFLLLGIVGIVLPIMNGTIFLIIAFILFSFESNYLKKALHNFTQKNAALHKMHLYLETFMKKIFRVQ